jgi:hypothetical protein
LNIDVAIVDTRATVQLTDMMTVIASLQPIVHDILKMMRRRRMPDSATGATMPLDGTRQQRYRQDPMRYANKI